VEELNSRMGVLALGTEDVIGKDVGERELILFGVYRTYAV
jgi:hypothetical protein